MITPRDYIIPTPTPITASGVLATNLVNLGEAAAPLVTVLVTVGAVSGTTPSLILALNVGIDGTNYANAGALPAITTPGTYRMVFQNILDTRLQLSAALTGTTPSFTITSLALLMPSPNS